MDKTESLEVLGQHAICTMPDSYSGRRRLLEAVKSSLPPNNKVRIDAMALLAMIDAQDFHQSQLALSYSQKTDNRNNGQKL